MEIDPEFLNRLLDEQEVILALCNPEMEYLLCGRKGHTDATCDMMANHVLGQYFLAKKPHSKDQITK